MTQKDLLTADTQRAITERGKPAKVVVTCAKCLRGFLLPVGVLPEPFKEEHCEPCAQELCTVEN